MSNSTILFLGESPFSFLGAMMFIKANDDDGRVSIVERSLQSKSNNRVTMRVRMPAKRFCGAYFVSPVDCLLLAASSGSFRKTDLLRAKRRIAAAPGRAHFNYG
jgi:hypothetical protein